MFVPGKRSLKAEPDVPCQPCKDREVSTRAAGLCTQCQQHMCNKCFDTHKQFKVSKGHTLSGINESLAARQGAGDDDLENCDQHKKELVKFYCPKHEQVGCGDCMILEHKTCKVEYICDIASKIKEHPDFKSFLKETEKYQVQGKDIFSSIKKNKIDAENINSGFIKDVRTFSEDTILKINGLKETLINKAETVKCEEVERLDILETANEESMKEATQISERLQSQTDQPNKLFTNYIQQKTKFKGLQEEQERIKVKNTVRNYTFKPDDQLKRSISECKTLGSIQDMVDKDKETDVQERPPSRSSTQPSGQPARPSLPPRGQPVKSSAPQSDQSARPSVPPRGQDDNLGSQQSVKVLSSRRENEQENARQRNLQSDLTPQPLKARQLVCRNIHVEGEYLSFVDNLRGDVGIWIDKKGTDEVNSYYFELEIIRTGRHGYIAIGFVPKDYPANNLPGWRENSVGYHADDGCLFVEQGYGTRFGPKCYDGDRMGCYIQVRQCGVVDIGFSRNGEELGEVSIQRTRHLYPAIGLHSSNEKVKVILDAQRPKCESMSRADAMLMKLLDRHMSFF